MEHVLLYIPFPDKPLAEATATALLDARLVACANILPGATSLYRWEGKIQRAEECVMLAKTLRGRLTEIENTVKRLHPYECPCILALPIAEGHAPFLGWVADEVS